MATLSMYTNIEGLGAGLLHDSTAGIHPQFSGGYTDEQVEEMNRIMQEEREADLLSDEHLVAILTQCMMEDELAHQLMQVQDITISLDAFIGGYALCSELGDLMVSTEPSKNIMSSRSEDQSQAYDQYRTRVFAQNTSAGRRKTLSSRD